MSLCSCDDLPNGACYHFIRARIYGSPTESLAHDTFLHFAPLVDDCDLPDNGIANVLG